MDYATFADSLTGEGRRYDFKEIEMAGRGSLPPSAYRYAAWWSNSKTHPLMKKVLEAGYVSEDLDLENQRISFCRDCVRARNALGAKSGQNRGAKGTSKDDMESEKRFVGERDGRLANLKPDFVTDGGGIHFERVVEEFTRRIADGSTGIDKEASVQCGLATFLRERLPDYRIRREYNISHFVPDKSRFEKRMVDIVLFNASETERFAVEIKFPTNGAYPMYMFQCFQDVRFLEQLRGAGFTGCFFLLIASDSNFWRNRGKSGTIYEKFRRRRKMYGEAKNVGNNPEKVCLEGEYRLGWMTIKDSLRYCLIRV